MRVRRDMVVENLRGTAGSGGAFDGLNVVSAAAAVAGWLRAQPWYPGAIISWGSSAMGYAQWALAAFDLPGWRLAVIQDAPSEIYQGLAYPGGAFTAAVLLGWVEGVIWAKRHLRTSRPRIILAAVRGARRTKRALPHLPLAQANRHLLGHPVTYYQDWLRHERRDANWQAMDRRRHVGHMPPQVHLATGWYDVCLASTLADYATLREAGRAVRLVIGAWTQLHGSRDKGNTKKVESLDPGLAPRPRPARARGAVVPARLPDRLRLRGPERCYDLAADALPLEERGRSPRPSALGHRHALVLDCGSYNIRLCVAPQS